MYLSIWLNFIKDFIYFFFCYIPVFKNCLNFDMIIIADFAIEFCEPDCKFRIMCFSTDVDSFKCLDLIVK